jgi:hypothetical protein
MPVRKVHLVDFDPVTDEFWIAFMSGRTKASIKRTGAMVVFSNWHKGKLCRVRGGRIEVVADKNPDTHDGRCENCGDSIKAAAGRNNMHHPSYVHHLSSAGYQWRKNGSKIADPLELVRFCVECYQ